MENAELIKWVISIGIGSIIAVIASGVSLYVLIRKVPNELRKSDLEVADDELDVKGKTATVASKFEELANMSAQKAVDLNKQLMTFQENYNNILKELNTTKETLKKQSEKILEQSKTIQIQSSQINIMLGKEAVRDREIATITCDLNNFKIYNAVLIEELQNHDIPVRSMEEVLASRGITQSSCI